MIAVPRDNPLVMLFTVAAAGYLLGRVSFGGIRLGVAAVLLVGLAAGSLDPALRLPEVVCVLGLVLFPAGIGTRAGYAFVQTLVHRDGVVIFLSGVIPTGLAAIAALCVGRRILKIPLGILLGMYAGTQTRPAALAFAAEQAGNNLPGLGYARVYPVAIITKILLAQVLLVLLL